MKDTIALKEIKSPSNDSLKEGLTVEIVGGVTSAIIVILVIAFWNKITNIFNKIIKLCDNSFDDLKIRYSLSELKSNLKIKIIDDHDIFPVEGFKEFGYHVDRWEILNYERLKELRDGNYDIIVLDIHDIAKDIAEKDGLDILEDLKTNNPAQVIIAYSGHSFDLSKNRFWELADEKLSKPTPFLSTQQTIDLLIEKVFTIDYFKFKILSVLKENHIESEFQKIQKKFIQSKRQNAQTNWYEVVSYLGINNKEKEKLSSILSKLNKYTSIK